MIATTTLLVVAVVGGFGVLDAMQVAQIYDDSFNQRAKQYDDGLRVKGEATVAVFSQAALGPLVENAWEDVRGLVRKVTEQDPDLATVYVLDRNRNLVAHSGQTTYPEQPVPVSDPSWSLLLEKWTRREADRGALAQVDFTRGGAVPIRFFAVPVMVGNAAATPEAAVRPEAGDDRIGYVVLGYSLAPIQKFAAQNEAAKQADQQRSLERTLLIGALFVLAGLVLVVLQAFRISRPIRLLTTRVSQIAQGDLSSRVEVRSGGEVGILGENFNHMADQLVVLLREAADKAALDKELEVTRAVQERLLPTQNETRVGAISLAAFYEPASQCGGDWWTCHEVDAARSLIVIGDVTGHGVPAAMVTATAKSACDVVRATSRKNLDLTQLLLVMNYAILESAKREFQMSCFASIYDSSTGVLSCVNAGHNPPLVYRPYIEDPAGRWKQLYGAGARLGDIVTPEFSGFDEPLGSGDIIVWYTDGILDCVNPNGVEYGLKRLMASISRGDSGGCVEIRDRIVADAKAFYGRTPRRDDVTLVVGKVDSA